METDVTGGMVGTIRKGGEGSGESFGGRQFEGIDCTDERSEMLDVDGGYDRRLGVPEAPIEA